MSTPADIRAAVSESSLAGGGVAPPAYTAPPVRTDAVPLEPSAPALALAPTAAAAEAAGITDFGPNVSSDADNFFQSDRDIELQRARKEKERRFGARGRPLQLPSKVLALELVQPPSVVVPDSAQLLDQAAADGANGLQELQEIEVSWAYVGESGHVARKVDLETGAVLGVFRGHTGPVTSLAVAYDARGRDAALFTGSWDKTIRKWNASDSSQIMCIRYHSDFVKSIRLHGSVLFSASADKTICMWNADTGAHVRTLRGHTRAVEDIVLSANGRILFSASSDTTVRKWDTNTGQVLAVLTGHQTSVYSLTLTADGSELWSVSADKTARRWDLETNACTCSFEHPDFVRSVLVIGESGLIATGSRDENVRIWNTATEKCIKVIEGHSGEVSAIRMGSNNSIWTGSLDATLRKWSLGDELFSPMDLAFSEAETREGALADSRRDVVAAAAKDLHEIVSGAAGRPISAPVMTEEEERELAELMGEL